MEYQEQDWLEQELKSALARKDPPEGFAGGVAEKLGDQHLADPGSDLPRGKVIPFPSRPVRRWLAAAAAVVLIAGGAVSYRHHQGEVAKRELMRAFFIAGGKLNHVQAHLQEVAQ